MQSLYKSNALHEGRLSVLQIEFQKVQQLQRHSYNVELQLSKIDQTTNSYR